MTGPAGTTNELGTESFWVTVNGEPYLFPITGQDATGQHIAFLAPLIFVSLRESQTGLQQVQQGYASDNDRRRCVVRGSKIAYADPAAGDTVLKTTSLYFTSEPVLTAGQQPQPPYVDAPFLPSLDAAAVTVPALSALLGNNSAVMINLYLPYLQDGLDPHAGVFAVVPGSGPPRRVPARTRAAASPSRTSRSARCRRARDWCPAPPTTRPAASCGPRRISARPTPCCSGRSTWAISSTWSRGSPTRRTNAPGDPHPRRPEPPPPHRAGHGHQLEPAAAAPSPQAGAGVTHRVQLRVGADPAGEDRAEARRHPAGFQGARPAHELPVDHVRGHRPGHRQDHLRLEQRRQVDGRPGPGQAARRSRSKVALAVHPDARRHPAAWPVRRLGAVDQAHARPQLEVSYTIGIPPITCGVFSLTNIAIMAGLDLPYLNGKPALEFAFASRNRPFLVTVEIFGGGGFVHVVLDADGVKMVEGAIEFGAQLLPRPRRGQRRRPRHGRHLLPAQGHLVGPDRLHRHRRRGVGSRDRVDLAGPEHQPELAASPDRATSSRGAPR